MKTRKRYRPSPFPLVIALLSLQLLNVGHEKQQAIAQKNSEVESYFDPDIARIAALIEEF